MPFLDNCCRCCTLRTGTIVTGSLGIVSGIKGQEVKRKPHEFCKPHFSTAWRLYFQALGLVGLITVLSVEKLQVKTIVVDTLPDTVGKILN